MKDFKIIFENASSGDAKSQFLVGEHYEINHDYSAAVHWYQKACDQNYPEALNALGTMYMRGTTGKKDIEIARELFTKAASMNYNAAFFCLGTISIDVDNDYKTGIELWKKSANLGDYVAARTLGKIYLEGSLRQPRDYSKAISWFEKAYKLGDGESVMYLCDIYAGFYSKKLENPALHSKWLKIEGELIMTGKMPLFHMMPIGPNNV